MPGEAAAAAAQPQDGQQDTGISNHLMVFACIFLISNVLGGMNKRKQEGGEGESQGRAVPGQLRPFFAPGEDCIVEVFLTRTEAWRNREYNTSTPLWRREVAFGSPSQLTAEIVAEFNITTDEWLLGNNSMWAHAFLYKASASPDKKAAAFNATHVVYAKQPVVRYFPPQTKEKRNLWTGDGPSKQEDGENQRDVCTADGDDGCTERWQARWLPQLTLSPVEDLQPMAPSHVPPQLKPFLRQHQDGFWPIFWFNNFWTLSTTYMPINDTLPQLPLRITYVGQGFMKYLMTQQMEENIRTQTAQGLQTEAGADEMKRMLLETSPVLLGATLLVTVLHTVFSFLAFKNDISFWRNQESMKGLSITSVAINAVAQTIITLYLFDEREDTNWMVLATQVAGVAIAWWKVSRAIDWEVQWTGRVPRLRVGLKHQYKQSGTSDFDQRATRYLAYALTPCLAAFALYSLVYGEHKGVYSFIIHTLVQFVYWFGFAAMTPQLFINYKLKSVAHLPWKAFTYKALGTFIDDLFAFIITMPMAHRLACLRDDAVFVVFLFQYWIYKVDKTRVNEYGQCGLDEVSLAELEDKLRQVQAAPASTERDLQLSELQHAIEFKKEAQQAQLAAAKAAPPAADGAAADGAAADGAHADLGPADEGAGGAAPAGGSVSDID
eukprot:TRINITY_DN12664_c0_g1_i1.p1 TRINITY_DN12664_c0_g1~~TRINITY_DN12664_c0_g1_i1.p1  ORF type:complete len:692 (+),score=259.43 TRINITY_DN12664_c0_g1_i1:86-2077(+)